MASCCFGGHGHLPSANAEPHNASAAIVQATNPAGALCAGRLGSKGSSALCTGCKVAAGRWYASVWALADRQEALCRAMPSQ